MLFVVWGVQYHTIKFSLTKYNALHAFQYDMSFLLCILSQKDRKKRKRIHSEKHVTIRFNTKTMQGEVEIPTAIKGMEF